MKKEFSFYEFVGILVPSVTLLYFSIQIVDLVYAKKLMDFSKIGESLIFFIIAYGIGHILHSLGNIFESIFWKVFRGMPTQWLTTGSRFKIELFDRAQTEAIRDKVFQQFGRNLTKDYGRDVYNWLSLKEKLTEKRIDIFTGNYSMFRGLAVAFYILTCVTLYLLGWKLALIPFILAVLANLRMFRFAKLYAQEVFRSFQNYNNP
jgi:ABC-type multidrug transport system fused ATPase/permease subunit